MRLNLDILCDYLPANYKPSRYGPPERRLQLLAPLPVMDSQYMTPGNCYIIMARNFPQQLPKDISVICVGNPLPQYAQSCGVPVLHLAGSNSIFQCLREISFVFSRFEEWDTQLRDELEKTENFDISRIVSLGVEVFENPIGVSNHVLDNVIYVKKVIDEAGERNVFNTNKSHSPLSDPLRSKAILDVCNEERTITAPYLSTIPGFPYSIYCNNIYSFDCFMGCIHVSGIDRPLRESDFALADYYFPLLCRAALKQIMEEQTVTSQENHAVQKLLAGKELTADEQEKLALKDQQRYVAFSLQGKQGERHLPREYLRAMLCAMMPDNIYAAIHEETILGLIRMTSIDANNEELFTKMRAVIQQMGYVGSISNAFVDIGLVMQYIEQAQYVLEFCPPQTAEESLRPFQNYVLPYTLHKIGTVLEPQTLYTEGLCRLLSYDKRKNSDYARTLDVYLSTETSITQTAETLYIHRSSLLKRLERIQKLLDMDLEDPDVRLYLRLCLQLLKKKSIKDTN